ncbi:IucA/IucC family protein [Stappia sp.]|uniref:IucA/IucC family protein n=1 Tax=Stappia sp. TaxID=1870903 RepID=UPI003A994C31
MDARTMDFGDKGSEARAVAHVRTETWATVNRHLLRKAIAEFAHELLIEPKREGGGGAWTRYRLEAPAHGAIYRFRARRLSLDAWLVDPASIEKTRTIDGKAVAAPLSVLSFIIEFQQKLGIRDAMLPVYLDEIASILYSSAYKRENRPHDVDDLADADFQTIETTMSEGHPSFVANSGRLGFSTADYPRYAPEAAGPLPIVWIAVDARNAAFTAVSGLDHMRLMAEELGPEAIVRFNAEIAARGLDPARFLFMPVHPWQWFNRISMSFAPEIAEGRIVYLGLSPDLYQPQQSIRTFFNATTPSRRYVKMALSILNMGFLLQRGLSREDMETTPPFNDWLQTLLSRDAFLQKNGFTLIREVATMSYLNAYHAEALPENSPYRDVLAAVWRENPVNLIRPGERLMTMAALLHVDPQGKPLAGALIARSGLDAADWIRRYLEAYLVPLLHCYYAYDLIFMPHGENVILVMEGAVPSRIVMKDLAEEMRVLEGCDTLPPAVRRNCVTLGDEVRLDGIFTDVFDCFFRHLSVLLEEAGVLSDDRFWQLVADSVLAYQRSQPQLAEKFARHDLFRPEFPRNCINRLQLRDNQQLIDPDDPEKGFQYAGTLTNPLAEADPRGAGGTFRRVLGRIAGRIGGM